MSKRQKWVILGRVIGTATGWDQADTFVLQVYDFEPAEGVLLPADECVSFDFEKGRAEIYDDAGQLKESFDIISVLSGARQSL